MMHPGHSMRVHHNDVTRSEPAFSLKTGVKGVPCEMKAHLTAFSDHFVYILGINLSLEYN